MIYWFIKSLAWVVWHLGFRIKVVGKENLITDRGFILCPNHISAIDPVFVVIARYWGRKLMVLGKQELFGKNAFVTWFMKEAGVVPVARGKGDTSVLDKAIAEVKDGGGLLIFPEGTRSKDGSLGKIKSGAFVIASEAQADMIPCRIIYKGGKMKLFGKCTVVFGKPIPKEELALGQERSAAKLRACKQRFAQELEDLLEQNKQHA